MQDENKRLFVTTTVSAKSASSIQVTAILLKYQIFLMVRNFVDKIAQLWTELFAFEWSEQHHEGTNSVFSDWVKQTLPSYQFTSQKPLPLLHQALIWTLMVQSQQRGQGLHWAYCSSQIAGSSRMKGVSIWAYHLLLPPLNKAGATCWTILPISLHG